jgi:hypothetical protein
VWSGGAPAVAEDDDLEEHSPARPHGRGSGEREGWGPSEEDLGRFCASVSDLLWDWSGSRPLSRKRKPEGVLMEGCSTCLDGCAAGKSYWLFRQLVSRSENSNSRTVNNQEILFLYDKKKKILRSKRKEEILFLLSVMNAYTNYTEM